MALIDYRTKHFVGGFGFSWTPGFTGAAAIDLGTTERGFRLTLPIKTIQVLEDRFLDTVVDEILLGSDKGMLTLESLQFRVGTVNLLRYALAFASGTGLSGTTTPTADAPSATVLGIHEETFGNDIISTYAGELVCTCLTGNPDLIGKTLTFGKAFPLESEEILLTARGLRVPFSFSCWAVQASSLWNFWTIGEV